MQQNTNHKKSVSSRETAFAQSSHDPVLSNAVRLLEDARILRKSRRYPSATALAILSLEELGKFRALNEDLIFWISRGEKRTEPGRQHLYGHKRKQNTAAEALIDAMGIDEVRDLVGAAGYSMVLRKIGGNTGGGPSIADIIASIDEPTFQNKVANKIRRSKHHRFVIDLAKGGFDKVKQQSIYVDRRDDGKCQEPILLIGRPMADRIIGLASGGIYETQMSLRYAQAFRRNFKSQPTTDRVSKRNGKRTSPLKK
jgi:AbiV family abortive infection protein